MKAKHDCATDHLVGIDGQVEAVMDLLGYDFGCARFLGIYGPAGIGKTTLAQALFDKLIPNFDRYCFLRDVRGTSRRHGLLLLQRKLLFNILGENSTEKKDTLSETRPMVDIDDIDDGMKVIREKLHDKKVLVVLDDVDHREQLENLIGKISRFAPRSRVVITTRDNSILETGKKIILYELKEMNFDQALQLFINHALKRESPRDDYHDWFSGDIFSTIGGLPLIVKVIGSFLRGKHETVWTSTKEKLESIVRDVHQQLKISYDALNFQQKQIFLDIACFSFHEEEEITAFQMWKDCNFFPQIEIEVLSSLSLINIGDNGGLWMHDLLKDLGRQIVHEEDLDPGKHSRLWIPEEAMEMVKKKENKENIEALRLAGDPTLLTFTDEDFARLPNLRFLELDEGNFIGDFTNLFSKLRWFSWCHYSPDLIAINLFPQNLVVLQLSKLSGTNHWEGWSQIEMLHNLKVLELTRLDIIRIDLSGCFTLERLTIKQCQHLVQIDPSIQELKRLIYLIIEGCSPLQDLPREIGLLVKLKHLSLRHCSKLSILPSSIGNLESLIELDLSFTCIELLPESVGNLKTLNVIKMESCRLKVFPTAICLAMILEVISARRCSKMVGEVSREIGVLSFLRILDLSYTDICQVPETIGALPHLEELILLNCNELQVLPSLPISLTHLLVISESLQFVPNLSNLTNLINLLLSDSHEYRSLPSSSLIRIYDFEWIGELSKLGSLELCLPNLVMTPTTLGSLSNLSKLSMSGHVYPEYLRQPSRSEMLGNPGFKTTFPGLFTLRNLITLELRRSLEKEIQLGGLEQLRHLTVRDFPALERIMFPPSGLKNLKELELHECPIMREIYGLGALETLNSLQLHFCSSIRKLRDLSRLQKLMELKITHCTELRVLEGLDDLGCLSLFEVISCRSLEFWTNASDTTIPDGCQVVIERCPKLGGTPWHGMFYNDYRDRIPGRVKSDSDTRIFNRMDKVAKTEEKRQVASIGKYVGIDDQVNHIMSLTNIDAKDKWIVVVIHGEAGIGKTTLAKLIYNQVFRDFDGCSFLADIKETTQVLGGLQLLQAKLFYDVLKQEPEDVAFVNRGIEFFRDLFCNMRVLIILDDVENAFHFQKLIGDCFDCFASGSRILVTTRNSVVLEDSPQIRTYHVSRLDKDQALQLFRQHASIATSSLRLHGPVQPSSSLINFEFSEHAFTAIGGLPLSIEVTSAVLNGKTEAGCAYILEQWKKKIERWDFRELAEEGYRTLHNKNKQIFLDIACFTTGRDFRIAWYLWRQKRLRHSA